MMDDDLYSDVQGDVYDEELDSPEPSRYWTLRRILFTLIILLALLAFLAYSLQGLFIQPPPPLPPTRLPPMI